MGAVTVSPKTQGSRFTMTLVNFGERLLCNLSAQRRFDVSGHPVT